MRKGKISYNNLIRSVLREPFERKEKAHVAEDGAFMSSAGNVKAAVNTTVYGGAGAAELAFYRAFNSALAAGIRPEKALLSMTLPLSEKEAETAERMRRFGKCAESEKIDISGGHTTYSDQISAPVLTVVISGKFEPLPEPAPGDAILMTKFTGDAGAQLLLRERSEELYARFRKDFLAPVHEASEMLSCTKEAAVLRTLGASMHDVSEGGIFGALYEFSEGHGAGFTVSERKIPIHQETVEICDFLGGNPYTLLSTGCMLASVKDGEGALEKLHEAGVPAVLLGTVTEGRKKILLRGDEERFLERPEQDFVMSLERFG